MTRIWTKAVAVALACLAAGGATVPKKAAPVTALAAPFAAPAPGKYQSFRVAIYIVVNSTKRLADPATREAEFERVSSQLKFDKVYLEVYRNKLFATDDELEAVKKFLGVQRYSSFGWHHARSPAAKAGSSGRLITRRRKIAPSASARSNSPRNHFNEVILDDFFFYTSKSDADNRRQRHA